jgi:hypothetical protein
MINRTIPSGRENWLCHRAGIFVKRPDAMLSRSVAGYKPRHDKFARNPGWSPAHDTANFLEKRSFSHE